MRINNTSGQGLSSDCASVQNTGLSRAKLCLHRVPRTPQPQGSTRRHTRHLLSCTRVLNFGRLLFQDISTVSIEPASK